MSINNLTQILTKGLQSSLSTTAIGNGILRFTTDTGKLYFDINNTRTLINDAITDYTDSQIKNLNNPSTVKLYVASDTHRIYVYNGTSMIDVATIVPVDSTATTDTYIWMGSKQDGVPSVDPDLTYNPSTKDFRAGGLKVTKTTEGNTPVLNFYLSEEYSTK